MNQLISVSFEVPKMIQWFPGGEKARFRWRQNKWTLKVKSFLSPEFGSGKMSHIES